VSSPGNIADAASPVISGHRAAATSPGINTWPALHEGIFTFQNLSIAYLWDRLKSTLPGISLINIIAYQLEEAE
jgi:hypothetical protein